MGSSFFYIPAKERLAIFLLSLIIVAGYTMSSVYHKVFGPKPYEIIEVAATIVSESKVEKHEQEQEIQDIAQLPIINISHTSKVELIKYGFSSYAASNLVKYQNAGGNISSLEDLSKIYGVDKTHIESISDKIRFKKVKADKTIHQTQPRQPLQDTIERLKESTPLDYLSKVDDNNNVEIEKRGPIDPNTASLEDLQSIGLSKYAANNLLKYRSKGGRIYKASEMLKIYGVDSSSYSDFQEYISIPSFEKETKRIRESTINAKMDSQMATPEIENKEETAQPRLLIDINFASEEELQTAYGIGPVISKGIVTYRARLGGYVSLEQLKEVFGVKEESFDTIKEQLTISGEITKIYVPALSFKEVLKHPYLDYETTKLLKNIHYEIYDDKIKQLIQEEKIDPRLVPYLHLDIPQEYLRN